MHEIWALVNEMSPYLLLGFAFAGLLHSFVPASLYRRYLGKNSFSSVIWAALLGVPLPLCSCGVIPTAMSLRKEGASKGATDCRRADAQRHHARRGTRPADGRASLQHGFHPGHP